MIIRRAELKDAKKIAEYLLLAMEEIVYEFIDQRSNEKALAFMNWCVENENTQYSYQNAWVAEDENQIIGAVVIYDGAELHFLRKNVENYIKTVTIKPFKPEDETQEGEYYIDSFGVSKEHQGKGVGSKMLSHLIQEYSLTQGLTLGLLVEKDNPAAKRLYERLGFKKVGEKMLVGKQMEHMQISAQNS
jgi:ribosomal protein S18 acetylase RimI-like enzyme